MEHISTSPGVILQRMGIEVAPDDHRSSQEILNDINRKRIAVNILMEPDAQVRNAMAEFALRTYPLSTDKIKVTFGEAHRDEL